MYPSIGLRIDPTIRKRKRNDEDSPSIKKRTVDSQPYTEGGSYPNTEAQPLGDVDGGAEKVELEGGYDIGNSL